MSWWLTTSCGAELTKARILAVHMQKSYGSREDELVLHRDSGMYCSKAPIRTAGSVRGPGMG